MVRGTTYHDNQRRIKKRYSQRRTGKINCSGLENNRGRLDKKRKLGLLILKMWSNNPLLLTNIGASSRPQILFKLFLPKSKRINLAFCQPINFNLTISFIGFYYSYVFEEFSSNPFNSRSSSLLNSLYSPVGTSNLIFIILTRFNDRTVQPKASHILLI